MKLTIQILIIALTFIGVKAKAQKPIHSSQLKEIKAKIAGLPEVRDFMKQAANLKPMIMIDREPSKDFKYYWVKVGTSNLDMFRTNFDFYVDSKSFEIFYLDLMVDDGNKSKKSLTLQQWRHWRKDPRWQKMHKYRNGKILAS